jgi:hypothetical protein
VSGRVVIEDFFAVINLERFFNMEQRFECGHFVVDDLHVGGVGRV